jgi:hypothetical protein
VRIALLVLVIFGCTLVPAVFVWGNSGSFRTAVSVWWSFSRYLLVLAVPGIITSIWFGIFGP